MQTYFTENDDISFDSYIKVISVTSKSTPGSLLGTVEIFINEEIINNSESLSVIEYINGIVHNNSEASQYYHSWHNIGPTFHLTANNTFSSQMNDYSITFNASSLAKLRDTPSAQCTDGTTRYLILKLNIVLTSDSLYHLGDHSINIYANLDYDYHINTFVILEVQAGMFKFNCS